MQVDGQNAVEHSMALPFRMTTQEDLLKTLFDVLKSFCNYLQKKACSSVVCEDRNETIDEYQANCDSSNVRQWECLLDFSA